jgi:hypothetical protein
MQGLVKLARAGTPEAVAPAAPMPKPPPAVVKAQGAVRR